MKIIRIPHNSHERGTEMWAVKTLRIKAELKEHGLIERRDYDCNYTSKHEAIEMRFYDPENPAVSLFCLKYS
jgi:hypothetical protein